MYGIERSCPLIEQPCSRDQCPAPLALTNMSPNIGLVAKTRVESLSWRRAESGPLAWAQFKGLFTRRLRRVLAYRLEDISEAVQQHTLSPIQFIVGQQIFQEACMSAGRENLVPSTRCLR